MSPRKITKFQLCEGHSSWRAEGRYRLAEFFCEGGDGNYCQGSLCRCHPGTDFYMVELCAEHGEMSYNWDRFPGERAGAMWEPFAVVAS